MNVNVIAFLVLLTTLGMLSYETNKFKQHPPKVLRHTNILVNNEQKELISYNHFSILFLLPTFE